jgi:hypothetical protein
MSDTELEKQIRACMVCDHREHLSDPTGESCYQCQVDKVIALITRQKQAYGIECRKDELLEIGLLAHKFEGQDYHCREIADAIDERLAALTNQAKEGK